MKWTITTIILKILKWTGLTIILLLALLFLAPYLFPRTVTEKIKEFANHSIKGELNFSDARLSFFEHFPSFTFTLHEVSLLGSMPYPKDTLIAADKISLGINLRSLLFEKKININKIFLSRARIHVMINEQGLANYNVYESSPSKKSTSTSDSATSLKLEKIVIRNSHLIYSDLSAPLYINAMGFNYTGNGDLSREIFDLYSHLDIDSINFVIHQDSYLLHKKIDANLIMKINTNSLDFLFEKNDLKINQLKMAFDGRMNFLKNGYLFDISVKSNNSDLHDFITALPPGYLSWLENTKVEGKAEFAASFKGDYIVSENRKPTLSCSAQIRDGFISYNKAPLPLNHLYLDFSANLISLNPDSLVVKLDSISFSVGRDFLGGRMNSLGLGSPSIVARLEARINLENLDRALGIGRIRWKGDLDLALNANGKFEQKKELIGFRKKTVLKISSIPSFQFSAQWKNGYAKYDSFSFALENMNLKLDASCPNHNYKNIVIRLDTINATCAKSFIKGSATLSAKPDYPLEAILNADLDLSNIKNSIPLDSLDLGGMLKADIHASGKFNLEKKLFPNIMAKIDIKNAWIQTKYYPRPVRNINLNLLAEDASGIINGLLVNIQPASFVFEGNPFSLEARVKDFDDPDYQVNAKGEIDLDKLYNVFAIKEVSIGGLVKADFASKGKQSQILRGDYTSMRNSGSLECRNLYVNHEYFSRPFLISEGLFNFQDDKMWFTKFRGKYGRSDFSLDGYLSNAINYVISNRSKLSGNFNLNSHFISVDELASFASSDSFHNAKKSADKTDSTTKETGVVMIPENLSFTLKATIDRIEINGLGLDNFSGGVVIDSGKVRLTETNFSLAGANILMDGLYWHSSPSRANFEYHLLAKEFDVKRAYREVKLFRDLASSASKAEGVISLDYLLKGKLNGKMLPVYPSLAGEGTVSVKNVKMYGLKLFNVVSNKTEKQELKDPELSKINIHSKIKNNIIFIDRFKFKTAGFRIRVEGQTSFDSHINFKIRVGLPPLGIIGIPVTATGTSENPLVKLGKNDNAALSETEDKDEEN
jgi:AsmA protein